jgi:hypothetical protein
VTDVPHFTWRQRFAIARQIVGIIWRGDVLLYRVGVAAGIIPAPPEGQPMSIASAFEGVIKTLLADSTWAQAQTMAASADKALKSGDLLVSVIKAHGQNAQDDVKLGLEAAAIVAPKLAASLSTFLAGPLGGPAMAIFTLWLTGLLTGSPIQPKDAAYDRPSGADRSNPWDGSDRTTPPAAI